MMEATACEAMLALRHQAVYRERPVALDGHSTIRVIGFRSATRTSMQHRMGPMTKRALLVVLVGSTLGMWSFRSVYDVAAAEPRPGIIVTRVFTGPDGQTHAEEIRVKMAPTDMSTEVSEMAKVPGVQFRRQAPNYFEDWHTAPRRQYVITLGGRGEIELSDGKKISLYPGRILLLEDLTGKGHISRGVGTQDRISILIPLAE